MATLIQPSKLLNSSSTSTTTTSISRSKTINAAFNFPKIHKTNIFSLPILQTKRLTEVFNLKINYKTITSNTVEKKASPLSTKTDHSNQNSKRILTFTGILKQDSDPIIVAKLHAIMEAVADRVEMHKNVCEQRNNWNSLLLASVNGIILAAATMAGISAGGPALSALKVASALLYLSATAMLVAVNKIQPSQLAEEQRNAARLFKNLYNEISTTLSIGHATSSSDVTEAMQRLLALDRAYPLPLLGAMIEKFPTAFVPAVWWPEQPRRRPGQIGRDDNNDWDGELEEEMREIIKVIKIKDKEDYIRLGKKALALNKTLAISGPILTGLGVVGSISSLVGPTTAIVGAVAGALAAVVNTVQHGGQVGMIFEMYRGNAGFFQFVEEYIESNLKEKDLERRENGKLFEMKVALMLGRSVAELRDVAAKSRRLMTEEIDEFASKLF